MVPRRGTSCAVVAGALGAFVAVILFTTVVNAVCRPLVGFSLHLVTMATGVGLTLLGAGAAYVRLRGKDVTPLVLVACFVGVLLWLFLDGLAVLVNQVASGAEPVTYEVTLVSAEHKRIRIGRHGAAFDATTRMVVDKSGTTIALGDFEHLKGTYPIGTKLRLTLHPGALGFAWIVGLEPPRPAKAAAAAGHGEPVPAPATLAPTERV